MRRLRSLELGFGMAANDTGHNLRMDPKLAHVLGWPLMSGAKALSTCLSIHSEERSSDAEVC